MFSADKYETTDINDRFTTCCVCRGNKKIIERHSSFMEALKLSRSQEYLNQTYRELQNEISESSLTLLINLIQELSIPSFCAFIYKEGHDMQDQLEELSKKDYIRTIVTDANSKLLHMTVILNAEKLKLYSNTDILETIYLQKEFNTPYNDSGYNARKHSRKRIERINSMVNDFTDEQKESLLENFNNRCAFTGKEVKLHFDHVIPISWQQVGTTLHNMLPIHSRINSSKGNNNVFRWYENNCNKYDLKEHLFIEAMSYIANLNGMTLDEYKQYVYECEANKAI